LFENTDLSNYKIDLLIVLRSDHHEKLRTQDIKTYNNNTDFKTLLYENPAY
jgi:hypothetical protein